MLAARIIPCLDVRAGLVVKGVRFSRLRGAGRPAELAELYQRQGADELVLLDISATPAGRKTRLEWVAEVRKRIGIPLCVGGGVNGEDDAGRLLEVGADKVAVNTAAVENPGLLERMASRFGSQCTVLALDATRQGEDWEVLIRSGRQRTGRNAVPWARQACQLGAGELLLTSFDRDGTRLGYDLELIAAVRQEVTVPIIASGGADGPEHMLAALRAGADAALAASIFHFGEYTVGQVKDFLARNGIEVRPC